MSEHGLRDTDAPYAPDEAEAIQRMLATPGTSLECPRCHGPLVAGTAVDVSASLIGVYIVRCPACRRALMASQVRPL